VTSSAFLVDGEWVGSSSEEIRVRTGSGLSYYHSRRWGGGAKLKAATTTTSYLVTITSHPITLDHTWNSYRRLCSCDQCSAMAASTSSPTRSISSSPSPSVAFLGPLGTYSHQVRSPPYIYTELPLTIWKRTEQATADFFGPSIHLHPVPTIIRSSLSHVHPQLQELMHTQRSRSIPSRYERNNDIRSSPN